MIRRAWRRLPETVRVIVAGVLVMGIGTQLWPVATGVFPPVAALAVMGLALTAYWLFFSGRAGWQATAATRARWTRGGLTRRQWPWALLVVIAFGVAFEASIFVTFRLVEIPAEHFVPPEGLRDLDRTPTWLLVIMSAVVAGVSEEVGLRGYVQRPLVARYGAWGGIAVATVVFAVVHLGQAWAIVLMPQLLLAGVMFGLIAHAGRSLYPAILAHVAIDVFNFAYWWWSVIDRDGSPADRRDGRRCALPRVGRRADRGPRRVRGAAAAHASARCRAAGARGGVRTVRAVEGARGGAPSCAGGPGAPAHA